ncbi:MAG TPA: hypothetical protein VMD91_11495 [Candidatus Sulfotelmatobacter sp.]|nr:hypothetical protein [Candidatus Sulfotelmatobacter sp.]
MATDELARAHERVSDFMVHRGRTDRAAPLAAGLDASVVRELDDLPVRVTYVDDDGRLYIGIDKSAPDDLVRAREDALRRLAGDVPLHVERVTASFDSSTQAMPLDAPSKNSKVRPLWGGVQMLGQGTGYGTLTVIVEASSVYAVVSSHVVGVGTTGSNVGQPDMGGGNKIGSVQKNPPYNNRSSDSALTIIDPFVTATKDRIWRAKDAYFTVTAKTAPPAVNTDICMQGAITVPLSTGKITKTGITWQSDYGTLKNQYGANYQSQAGDSGGPVFYYNDKPNNKVTLIGIHVATIQDSGAPLKLFSGWQYIKSELGLP